ncbi:MAG: mannonate dehydratase [Cytophagaceae bacterium]
MLQSWRWFGPQDPVSLRDIMQAGATGIVTALHHIPNGKVWSIDEIVKRKSLIEFDSEKNKPSNLKWVVTESIPVHEDIKTRSGNYKQYIENYKESISNLAQCGIPVICYNFMPVLDWTRTDLSYEIEDGCRALRFDMTAFAAFDLFILSRKGAIRDYTKETVVAAKRFMQNSDADQLNTLQKNIIAGLPGAEETYTLDQFKEVLNSYRLIDRATLKSNLAYFLNEIIPVAERSGVKMAIHPDDPPFPILGLPRIVSTVDDLTDIFSMVDSQANGFTLCSGSYGVLESNNLVEMVQVFGHKMHFIHLRNIKRESDGSFFESKHLEGDVNMFALVKAIHQEEIKRKLSGKNDFLIPMRPDHGHQMLDDLYKKNNPGYSAIGRLRGLAELRGLEMGIQQLTKDSIKEYEKAGTDHF